MKVSIPGNITKSDVIPEHLGHLNDRLVRILHPNCQDSEFYIEDALLTAVISGGDAGHMTGPVEFLETPDGHAVSHHKVFISGEIGGDVDITEYLTDDFLLSHDEEFLKAAIRHADNEEAKADAEVERAVMELEERKTGRD